MASILNIHLSKEGTVNILFTEQNLLKPPARALGLDMPDQQARPIPNGLVEVPSSCLILTESSRGKIKDFWLPVPEGLNPMAFGTAVTKAYVQNVGKFRRLYYHCVLFKQPVVSIASLAKTTGSLAGATPEQRFIVKASVPDKALTSAWRKPEVLSRLEPGEFFGEREGAFIRGDVHDDQPTAAILIHLGGDEVAAKIIKGLVPTAVSLAVKWADNIFS